MTFDRIFMLAALCLLLVCLLPSPALAQSFQGTFTGEGVTMTLQPSRDRYYGTLVFDDEFYSIEADEEDGELTGSFVTAKGEFDFKATFRGNRLALETNSVTYLLRRAGQGADDDPEPVVAAAEPAEPAEASAAEPAEPALESRAPALEPAAPAEPVEVAAKPAVAEAAEPAAEAQSTSDVLVAQNFEEGTAAFPKADQSEDREGTRPAGAAAEPVAAMPGAAEPVAAKPADPVDEALVGAWQRGKIDADGGALLAGVTELELAAAGTFVTVGASGSGHWKVAERTLFLRSTDAEEWQPYCRYKVVADTLLCTVGEDSRQLWFRR